MKQKSSMIQMREKFYLYSKNDSEKIKNWESSLRKNQKNLWNQKLNFMIWFKILGKTSKYNWYHCTSRSADQPVRRSLIKHLYFRQFATNVSLYPLLWDDEINNGLSLSNLISLCSHENNDIAAAVIQTLYELVDQVSFGFGSPWRPGPKIGLLTFFRSKTLNKRFTRNESIPFLGRIWIRRIGLLSIEKIHWIWSPFSCSWMHEKIWWKCYGRTRRTLYMFPTCWIRYGRFWWS